MDLKKYTQKSLEAVQSLEKIAVDYGNQQIVEEHLMYALLKQDDSLILKMIEKMQIQKWHLAISMFWKRTVKPALCL